MNSMNSGLTRYYCRAIDDFVSLRRLAFLTLAFTTVLPLAWEIPRSVKKVR